MKKVLLATLLASFSLFANEGEIEKSGFLTTQWCVDNDMFADCRLESYVCGEGGCFKDFDPAEITKSQIVLYVHDELKSYPIDTSGIHLSELLEKGANKNEVTITGELEDGTIKASEFQAPPPPKKSFFKGCL